MYFVMMFLSGCLNMDGFFLGNSSIRFCNTVTNLGFTRDSHLTESRVKPKFVTVSQTTQSLPPGI